MDDADDKPTIQRFVAAQRGSAGPVQALAWSPGSKRFASTHVSRRRLAGAVGKGGLLKPQQAGPLMKRAVSSLGGDVCTICNGPLVPLSSADMICPVLVSGQP
ncbi:hypothetical protein VTJ04DRAFT_1004 [Mycothermus thermophilus]|uniref:uncharacterized protein n=1 Tax=Humicola insolens TaxID=85995 RepID=UPI003742B26A